jgi:hypothetical protein
VNFKDQNVLVIDGGLFTALAELLVPHFRRVAYYCDWQSSFPDARELVVGEGLPGVDRIKYLWQEVNDFDLIVFPDCWFGDMQEYLRGQGKRIWGAGMGSDLELSRWKTKKRFPELGLPVNPSQQLVGVAALREHLKTHKDQYVKVSTYRGIGETFLSATYEQSEGQVNELESKLGGLAKILPFVVEDAIPDSIEVGYDGFCIDGEFPEKAFFGVEIKDQAYVGQLVAYDSLPRTVRDTNTKLSKALAEYTYRQFISTEIREKGGKGYLIDLTCRQASPAGETYCHAFENLPEILWYGAEGKLVNPECSTPFAAQIILCSEWAEEHWQPIQFPEEIRPWVKLFNHCCVDGMDYVVPQMAKMKQVGSVIGLGKTMDEAVKIAKERAEQVKGYDLESECDALDKAVEDMEALS